MPGEVRGDEAVRHVGKRRVRCSGRFFPNGSSAVDNTANQGKKGWTVAFTSTGLFTLTLDFRPLKLVLLALSLQQASAGTVRKVEWGTVVFNANGTTSVQIRVVDGSAVVQNLTANANTSISFEVEAVQDGVAG